VAGRPSLPGVDELFGSSTPRPRRDRAPAPEPDAGADAIDGFALQDARAALTPEGDHLVAARDRLGDAGAPPSPEVGGLLRWLVRVNQAKAVVEVGSAGGITGAWLLAALPSGGVLTSIEPDPHLHELAAQTYKGVDAGSRPRSIQGDPETVLPRLADGSYDLLLLQADGRSPSDLDHARRLLHGGGTLVVRGVLRPGEHAEGCRQLVEAVGADPTFDGTVLPVDGGLLLATRQAADET
jgi:predicted O-methyltransferase YrrM